MKGKIKSVIRKTAQQKGGFGFIIDEVGQERFFHARNLARASGPFESLREGLHVEFEPVTTDQTGKGNALRADNVRVIA